MAKASNRAQTSCVGAYKITNGYRLTERKIDRELPASFVQPCLSWSTEARPALLFSEKALLVINALQRVGVKHQNKERHMPWLANTFWQRLLSLVLFCCKHC